MTRIVKKPNHQPVTTFGDLKYGDLFIHIESSHVLYAKLREHHSDTRSVIRNAINLETGDHYWFGYDENVIPVSLIEVSYAKD